MFQMQKMMQDVSIKQEVQDNGPGIVPPQRMNALHRPRGRRVGPTNRQVPVELPLEEAAKRVCLPVKGSLLYSVRF